MKSNSLGIFATSNNLAKKQYSELKLFQTVEITINQVRRERVSSENTLEIERERPKRGRTEKVWSKSRKTRNGIR